MKYFICKNAKVFLVPKEKDNTEYIKNIINTKQISNKSELTFYPEDVVMHPGDKIDKSDPWFELSEKCYIAFDSSGFSDKYSKIIVNIIDAHEVEKHNE